MGEANAAVDRLGDFIQGEEWDKYASDRRKMPIHMNKSLQRLLQGAGYNIDYTNKSGDLVTGEDAVDGEWGDATDSAWGEYVGNLDKAVRGPDGEIKFLGGKHPIHETIESERGEVAKDLWGQISAPGKPQLSFTADDITGLAIEHDVAKVVALNKIDQDAIASGAAGLEFREHETRSAIKSVITTPEGFRDMAYSNVGDMEYTYAEQLGMPNRLTAEMWAGVTSAGIAPELDSNEDGKIDERDFTGSDAANMAILRKAMLDPDNAAAKGLFVDWYANGVKESHQGGLDRYNAKQGTTTTTTPDDGYLRYSSKQSLGGGVRGGNLNVYLDKFISGKITMQDGSVYNRDPKTNIWSTEDGGATRTGDEMLELYQNALNDAYPDSNIILRNEEEFAPFRGGALDSDNGASTEVSEEFRERTKNIITTGASFPGEVRQMKSDHELFNYQSGDYILNTLERSFKKGQPGAGEGFKFEKRTGRDQFRAKYGNGDWSDWFEYNHQSGKKDTESAQEFKQWMEDQRTTPYVG
jgi:hypothetical protein